MFSEAQSNQNKSSLSTKEELLKFKTNQKYLNIIISTASEWLYSKPEATQALSYIDSRIKRELQSPFNFGYFPNTMQSVFNFMDDIHKKNNKFDPKVVLESTGVMEFRKRKPRNFYYNNPLLIPYYDSYNNPVSIVGRTLLPEKEMKLANVVKYKNLPFKRGNHVFGLNLSRLNIVKKNHVVIVEGQFDMISCYSNNINNVVALCGSKVGFEHVLLLKRYTNNFHILLDNDEAGEKGWKAIKLKAPKYNLNVVRISLPEKYKDVDEALKNNDKSWLLG